MERLINKIKRLFRRKAIEPRASVLPLPAGGYDWIAISKLPRKERELKLKQIYKNEVQKEAQRLKELEAQKNKNSRQASSSQSDTQKKNYRGKRRYKTVRGGIKL